MLDPTRRSRHRHRRSARDRPSGDVHVRQSGGSAAPRPARGADRRQLARQLATARPVRSSCLQRASCLPHACSAPARHRDRGARRRAADGTTPSCSTTRRSRATRRGASKALSISLLDVTARDDGEPTRIQRELDDSVSLLRATLDSTADGMLVVDSAGASRLQREVSPDVAHPPVDHGDADDARAIAFVLDQINDPDKFVRVTNALYAIRMRRATTSSS